MTKVDEIHFKTATATPSAFTTSAIFSTVYLTPRRLFRPCERKKWKRREEKDGEKKIEEKGGKKKEKTERREDLGCNFFDCQGSAEFSFDNDVDVDENRRERMKPEGD